MVMANKCLQNVQVIIINNNSYLKYNSGLKKIDAVTITPSEQGNSSHLGAYGCALPPMSEAPANSGEVQGLCSQ